MVGLRSIGSRPVDFRLLAENPVDDLAAKEDELPRRAGAEVRQAAREIVLADAITLYFRLASIQRKLRPRPPIKRVRDCVVIHCDGAIKSVNR